MAIFRVIVWLTITLIGFASSASSQNSPAPSDRFAILVFTKTTGFRHDSIPAGIAAIQAMGRDHGFAVDATEDAAVFTDDALAGYRAVVFLNTTGDILGPGQQSAFERFIRNGGGFVGIHSATDTEYQWPFYGRLVGAYFASHPVIQDARITVVEATHLSTEKVPASSVRSDEWYDFRADPTPNVHVLITVDESTYSGGGMGSHHPISWYHEFEGGRAWYTAMGHTTESYSEPLFVSHVLGGIFWAANAQPAADEIKSGYVIVTPDPNSCCPNTTLTFALLRGGAVQSQAAIATLSLTTDAVLFVDVISTGNQNLGVAIVNPNAGLNTITLSLRNSDGSAVDPPAVVSLQPGEQIARFVTELFPQGTAAAFRGTLRVQASAPVSITGLRFSGSSFSTQPAANRTSETGLPSRTLTSGSSEFTPVPGTVGGADAAIFPQFATGAGWETQIALVNNSSVTITGRLDVFNSAGNPMAVRLNGLSQSTFKYSIPAEGAVLFAP